MMSKLITASKIRLQECIPRGCQTAWADGKTACPPYGFFKNQFTLSVSRKACKGFTLIELIVVIAILSILIATFLNRVEYYQELAEKTAMEQNVGALQNALTLQHSKHYVRGNAEDITLLPTENPMKWLQTSPQNYAGEFYDPNPDSVPPGSWVFDLKSHELIYVLNRTDHFVPGKDNAKWIRFHIALEYEAIKKNGVIGQDKELVGSVFAPVEKVNWF